MLDDQLETVSAFERRRILIGLLDAPEQDDLLDELLDPSIDDERFEELLELEHNHLPRLEDEGYVRWDRSDGVIRRGPSFDEIRPLLEFLKEYRSDPVPPGVA